MQNKSLIKDYLKRANHRLAAIDLLFQRESWADVVRESQETVELTLKALLMQAQIQPPRLHDVSDILLQQSKLFPATIQTHFQKMAEISRSLRRDRELAFYGSEDLTPSEFYKRADAEKAKNNVHWLVNTVETEIQKWDQITST